MSYKNPVLEEKPNHGHYPACLGRLEAITKQGTYLFLYSLVSSFCLSIISFTGNPLQVIGWIPILLGDSAEELTVGMSFFQMFLCWSLAVLGVLGSGKKKLFHVILFWIYLLMFLTPIFHMFSLFDAFTFIIGGLGVIYGYRAPKNYMDYQQLSETEGFPSFSIILAEHEEKKKRSMDFNDWYDARNKQRRNAGSQGAAPVSAPVHTSPPAAAPVRQEVKKHDPTEGVAGMPELKINKNVNMTASPDRFRPKSGKAGRISDSGMKFR
ncbi:MAG: hypothetical protein IKW96_06285 [Ruminococcus sp.]|uniref:hypothetical protein n=1 Tax=Ruminococcus sp. TaxID=41978 RepID=UPI0025FF3903|nr:hypothetical protein [Ruminococcus sp.]MBR5682870.1 hypothetical protein [Ruminococcus sp.]